MHSLHVCADVVCAHFQSIVFLLCTCMPMGAVCFSCAASANDSLCDRVYLQQYSEINGSRMEEAVTASRVPPFKRPAQADDNGGSPVAKK